jgi:hypothetical protein
MTKLAGDLNLFLFQVLSTFGDDAQSYACWYRAYGRVMRSTKHAYQQEITRIVLNSLLHSAVFIRMNDFQLFQFGDA